MHLFLITRTLRIRWGASFVWIPFFYFILFSFLWVWALPKFSFHWLLLLTYAVFFTACGLILSWVWCWLCFPFSFILIHCFHSMVWLTLGLAFLISLFCFALLFRFACAHAYKLYKWLIIWVINENFPPLLFGTSKQAI